MTFAFTDEQSALLETIGDVLGARCSGDFLRSTILDDEAWRKLWAELHALDIPGIAVPEDAGGLGLGPVELVGMAEAAGRNAAPVPLVATAAIFTALVAGADDASGRADVLRSVANGGATGTASVPLGDSGWGQLERGRLTIRSSVLAEAGRIDWVALPARDHSGATTVIVFRAADLPIEPVASMDQTRPLGLLELDRQPLADAIVLRAGLGTAFSTAWTAAAAELVGLGEALVARTIDHANERRQFGAPIGSFQAVKHMLVDAHLAVERARSLTYRAAAALADLNTTGKTAPRSAHLAKAAASEAATTAARTAVQVHGGIGITAEHDVSLLYLRARQAASVIGTAEAHYAAAALVP